jgi:flagellar biosynthesis protein FlhG
VTILDQANVLRNRIKYKDEKVGRLSRVIAIASGKGGVGKTNIALNLAISLKRSGVSVILLDFDFGLADAEILFGRASEYTLLDVFRSERSLKDVILNGPAGIKFISGGAGVSELANISRPQMNYVLRGLKYLDERFDYVIVDAGSGSGESVVNFARAAREVFIITTPEPPSVSDAIGLIKAVGTGARFNLIVNKAESNMEGLEILKKMREVSNIKYIGALPTDNSLIKAVKKQIPVTILFPNSKFSQKINKISDQLRGMEESGVINYLKKLFQSGSDD